MIKSDIVPKNYVMVSAVSWKQFVEITELLQRIQYKKEMIGVQVWEAVDCSQTNLHSTLSKCSLDVRLKAL